MTLEQRLIATEARIAVLESRVAMLEARGMTYGPLPVPAPIPNPWPNFQPPYTITCKMQDGTTKEITLGGPIVAQDTASL